MAYKSRRNERIPALIEKWSSGDYKHIIDLTHFEEQGLALEGKGSIVYDHRNRRFYCAISNRCHIEVVNELVEKFNQISIDGKTNPYKAITFEARDKNDKIIYHTDCMLTLHQKHAFACLDAIKDENEKKELVKSLTSGAHPVEILELSLDQILYMTANAQSIVNNNGEYCIVQSKQGYDALTEDQKQILNKEYKMVITDVKTIELVGGGSCRCMLVENWSQVPVETIINNLAKSFAETKNMKRMTRPRIVEYANMFILPDENEIIREDTLSFYGNHIDKVSIRDL